MLESALDRMNYRARMAQKRQEKQDKKYYQNIDWDAYYQARAEYESYIEKNRAAIAKDIIEN